MQILLDTNVILDLFLERTEFVENAALLWKAHETGRLTAFVSGITPVNLFYIARKFRGREAAQAAVTALLGALPVAGISQTVLQNALELGFKDYEDAVQHASAAALNLDAIITRNLSDFAGATIPVHSPSEFLKSHAELFRDLPLDE